MSEGNEPLPPQSIYEQLAKEHGLTLLNYDKTSLEELGFTLTGQTLCARLDEQAFAFIDKYGLRPKEPNEDNPDYEINPLGCSEPI